MTETARIDRRRTAPQPSPELAKLLAKWRASQARQDRSERTITERAKVVIRYEHWSGERPLRFTAEGMEAWTGRGNLSKGSKWSYTQALKAWHVWLQKQKLRKDNPTLDMDHLAQPKTKPRPLEEYQLAAVLRNAEGQVRMMVLLAAYAGLRVHEIAKIDGRDFDPIAGTLRVIGKGDKEETIALQEDVLKAAAGYPTRGPWFPNHHGSSEPITRQHVSKLIGDVMEKANLDATAHALRHTFATNLVNADVDMLTIQRLMRHASPTSTVIYADVNRGRRAEAVNRLRIPE